MVRAYRTGQRPLRRYALDALGDVVGNDDWLPNSEFKREYWRAGARLGVVNVGGGPNPADMFHTLTSPVFPDTATRPTFEPMDATPDDHGERFAADALAAAVRAARAKIPTDRGEDVTVELNFEAYGTPRPGVEYNPYTSVDGTLEIDDDDPTIECWIRLSPAWFAATQRYGGILIDELFPMSFDDWDQNRPTRIAAIRAIPEALLPPDQGDGWLLGVSDATVSWDEHGVPHADWVIDDDHVHEYADENGRQTGHPPVRNIYDWNDTEAIAEFEREQARDIARAARYNR